MYSRPVLPTERQRRCQEQPQAVLPVQPHHPRSMLWTPGPLLWIPGGQAMHHHQDESGMKGKEGMEGDGVARRHGGTEIMKPA